MHRIANTAALLSLPSPSYASPSSPATTTTTTTMSARNSTVDPFADMGSASGSGSGSGSVTPQPLPEGAAPPTPYLTPQESTAFLDQQQPLMPPNPNRFSSFTPSLALADSPRESALLGAEDVDASAAVPLTGAAATAAGAGASSAEIKPGIGGDPEKDILMTTGSNSIAAPDNGGRNRNRTRILWTVGILAFIIVAAAVAVPIGVIFGRKNSTGGGSGSSGSASGGSGSGNKGGIVTGADGSTVTTEDGDTFVYSNKFGGFWYWDPEDPFNNNAQPNSWTPPLNASWNWGVDKIAGTNIGGLFVLEPFIVPALFQKYNTADNMSVIDEWTLSLAMAQDTSSDGGLSQLEDHYNTFITEQDIAQIAGAGLNWIRLPIPFWAVEKWDTSSAPEPFLARTCWNYILRVLRWCRKYGLRVNLDLHTAPGSQNGYNHSGKDGQINFMNGPMGFANAQRMLEYIRIITEFISQPEYQDLIPMFGVINEPLTGIIGQDNIGHFYLQAHDMVRSITGYGEGSGAFISIHDGFQSLSEWVNFLPGADRVALDTHPYFAFGGEASSTDPIEAWPQKACLSWGLTMNQSQIEFGVSIAGEFSNGINDCGLYLQGVGGQSQYPGGCDSWNDYAQWNDTLKAGLKQFALASMDALQNYFFWTWKVGNASDTGTVQAPLWSYQLGLENGWMPDDPRSATGMCQSLSATGTQFPGTFASAWMTGGPGAGTISASVRESFTAWPPTTISGATGDMNFLPTYTSTVTISTLPTDTFFSERAKTVSVGDGWADASDTASGVTEIAGCSYLSAWGALGNSLPTTTCGGGATAARMARELVITPPPTP
ncbi:hypothetical protein ACEPAF_7962 [Sanghuangporus sanghuang]